MELKKMAATFAKSETGRIEAFSDGVFAGLPPNMTAMSGMVDFFDGLTLQLSALFLFSPL